MSRPSLSVIIPTKNEGRYIGRTLSQFEPYWERYGLEIIVSDANSTDGTAETVRAYTELSGGRVKLVQSIGKQNIAIGRNLGAAQAQADILLHTDADMRLPEPEKFFREALAAFDNAGTVAATVPLWVYPEESRLSDRLYHILMNTVIRLSFLFGLYLAKGECQLVRSDTFRSIGGYNEALVAGEDCNLFYRLHKKGRIAYLHRLSVHHSPRRFREYGYLRLSLIYLREGLWMLFRHRSYSQEWKPVR